MAAKQATDEKVVDQDGFEKVELKHGGFKKRRIGAFPTLNDKFAVIVQF